MGGAMKMVDTLRGMWEVRVKAHLRGMGKRAPKYLST